MTYMTIPRTGVLEVTVAAAKAQFAACVREAEQGTTVVITKHGRRVAALVPAEDVEELRRGRSHAMCHLNRLCRRLTVAVARSS